MSRVFIISDPRGERRLAESDLPFSLGRGPGVTIALPDPEHHRAGHEEVLGWIAYSEGHPFVQPADGTELFHNRERIQTSTWLKSGDGVQSGGGQITWEVKGDQVFIRSLDDPLSAEAEAAGNAAPTPDPKSTPTVALTPEPAPSSQAPEPWEARMKAAAEAVGEDFLDETREPAPTLDRAAAAARPLPRVGAPPSRGHKTIKFLLVLTLIGLLGAAAFLLLATPININVEPEPDTLVVDGFPPTFEMGGRHLALPGRYTIEATKPGYTPLNETLIVAPGDEIHEQYTLKELPGKLQLSVSPNIDYQVLVNQLPYSIEADKALELPPGSHNITVQADRYLPYSETLEIQGKGAEQSLDVDLRPAWANITVHTLPEGAVIQLNGKIVGVTPKTLELMQGNHLVQLSLEQYKTRTLPLNVRAGQDRNMQPIVLPPADGIVELTTNPEGATVTVNNAYMGITPVKIELPPEQQHTIKLSHPGHVNREARVTLEPGEWKEMNLKLNPSYGIVFLKSKPADAQLLIDGKPSGKASRRLRLPTRAHELTIKKPGFLAKHIRITPKAGSAQRFSVILDTPEGAEETARQEQMTATKTTADGQTLLLIRPGGAFQMGASRREQGRRANENKRLVQLTRPYYLADKELTNARYKQFKQAHNSGMGEGSSLDTGSQPVVNVSWDDAARFCNYLSKKDGLSAAYKEANGHMRLIQPVGSGYRLPSEAEWAYAARIHGRQDTALFPWGQGFPPKTKVGNYADVRISDVLAVTVPDYDDGYRVSAPVGSFKTGPSGFLDLGGNVAEWTGDYYALYPGEAKNLVKDPMGPATGEHWVVKDVGWKHGSISELRLSYRDYSNKPRDDLGFRIARYAY